MAGQEAGSTSDRLYTTPRDEIGYELVRQFVLNAEAADLFTESLTFEAKEKRHGFNVADGVAALSNTDGGIVLVGVRDRDAVGEDRIVGVSQKDHDALVSHLHGVIPGAMPEVIPVAIPGTDRLIIVLRIDADAVLHPVIVSGRVLYRLPGQNASADRQRVIGMIARDSAGPKPEAGPMQIISPSWRPQDIPLWPASVNEPSDAGDEGTLPATVTAELRVIGGLILPQRVLDRPWLDSKAQQATINALNNSPLQTTPHWALRTWELENARSSELRLEAAGVPARVVHAEARARVRLSGRNLALLVGLRWSKVDGEPFRLEVDTFHDALLASMVTVGAACAHIAKGIGAAAPVEPRIWETWLTSTGDNDLNAVDIRKYRRNKTTATRASFPPIRIQDNDLPHLDQAARDLLTYWLLELGVCDFEDTLTQKPVPSWLRWPELA